MRAPNIFSISPDKPFLPVLVEALLAGELVPGFDPHAHPLALADVTIYVPTRRAARVLPEILRKALGNQVALLPRIRPLGDVEEDEQVLRGRPDTEALPPAIDEMDRKLAMTRLVWAWKGRLRSQILGLPEDEISQIPASVADAAWLASNLLTLMDEVQTEEADWHRLQELVPAEHAQYWQITLEFLKIVTDQWPAFLQAAQKMDPKHRRSALIRKEARRLVEDPPSGPVIIAGATGSFPATAELMKAVLALPNGALVLPGLDHQMDEPSWQALLEEESGKRISGHAQYSLRALLQALALERKDVHPLGSPNSEHGAASANLQDRIEIVGEALRPAETTEKWRNFFASPLALRRQAAFADISQITAKTQAQEALAIALCLREAVEGGKQVALVTPDRALARRVASDLTRWSILVDDTAGRPLEHTPPMVLCMLVAKLALQGLSPVELLALLKHPLARLEMQPKEIRSAARALERGVLRGPQPRPGTSGLLAAIAAAKAQQQENAHVPRWKKVLEEDWEVIEQLVTRLQQALAPLEEQLQRHGDIPLADLVKAHVEATLAVAKEPDGSTQELFKGENGQALAVTLTSLLEAEAVGLAIPAEEWPGVFAALTAGSAVRSRLPADPRIHLLGPMEARLQSYDLVVLGGLNEGTWPQKTRNDPWLNRPMKGQIGLDPPERRIGTAAHDFLSNLGAPEVVLSRAQRVDGAPTVASRWLQRINTLAGAPQQTAMQARGSKYLHWAEELDRAFMAVSPAQRPHPKPPVVARPRQLSVTMVETLIRDPYEVYARKVLALDEVDPIGGEPNAADKGTIIHEALANFLDEHFEGPYDERAVAALLDAGRRAFGPVEAFPEIRAIWWPRFERIAREFVAYEHGNAPDVYDRFLETFGSAKMQRPGYEFELTGRADRIDQRKAGELVLIDYKTGVPPTQKQVEALLSPQLPLEVAMLRRGAFEDVPSDMPVANMSYMQLTGGRPALKLVAITPKEQSVAELAEEAWQKLERLVSAYENPAYGYMSRARVLKERQWASGYDHLARVAEWSLSENGEDS
ncbi:double-strand break repair protein AddB [Polycladidibacter hongkongensis]|uniref:double-strand break repair protein AddB n=1 Tax=Polycladidibacter hongkongensis TaxID=1647556 RepID=UPI000835708E|nr:double-strand break repair protein AddB [Pseudovibrio hongkongensis]